MDVLYLLKERTKFIRQFYDGAAASFIERKRLIQAGETPYETPYCDENSSGEPSYLEEWMEADESVHVLAYACISMLSAALQLYFTTWERELGSKARDTFKAEFNKGGIVGGYRAYFESLGISFDECPANLRLIEEVVLARNRIQHPDVIFNFKTHYAPSDLAKMPHPFFVDEGDSAMLNEVESSEREWLLPPTLHVTDDKLVSALDEIDRFCEWLDPNILSVVYDR